MLASGLIHRFTMNEDEGAKENAGRWVVVAVLVLVMVMVVMLVVHC